MAEFQFVFFMLRKYPQRMLVLLLNEVASSFLVLVSAGGITTILGSLLNGQRELPGLLGDLFRVLGLQDADTLKILLFMLGVLLLQILLESISKYIIAGTSVSLTKELRIKLNDGLGKVNWLQFSALDQGRYTQALVVESGLAGGTLIHLGGLLANGIVTIVLLLWMLVFSFETFVIFALASAALLLLIQPIMRRTKWAGERSIFLSKEIHNVTTDTRHLFKMLLAERLVDLRLALTQYLIDKAARVDLRKQVYGILNTQLLGLQSLAILLTVSLFHLLVWGSSNTDLIVSLIILQRIGTYFNAFQNRRQLMLQLMPSYTTCQELIETLDTFSETEGIFEAKQISFEKGIKLEEVSFKHPSGTRGIRNVSLTLPAKGLVFFVGKSGSGKTTLVDVISALIRPDEGKILIDGLSMTPALYEGFSEILSYVPQQAYLFKGTLRENLTLGNQASDDEIWKALEATECARLVHSLPQGLETEITSGGTNFSGGERHRLALSRAFLRKGKILVLDEPGASVDAETEQTIFTSLRKFAEDMLVIVITHSQEVIRGMQNIYLIHEGRLVWQGSHAELAKTEIANILDK